MPFFIPHLPCKVREVTASSGRGVRGEGERGTEAANEDKGAERQRYETRGTVDLLIGEGVASTCSVLKVRWIVKKQI